MKLMKILLMICVMAGMGFFILTCLSGCRTFSINENDYSYNRPIRVHRMDWIVLTLQANHRIPWGSRGNYSIDYKIGEYPREVLIDVFYKVSQDGSDTDKMRFELHDVINRARVNVMDIKHNAIAGIRSPQVAQEDELFPAIRIRGIGVGLEDVVKEYTEITEKQRSMLGIKPTPDGANTSSPQTNQVNNAKDAGK